MRQIIHIAIKMSTHKVCIVLEGDAMPARTKQLESRVKEGAIALIKRYLDVRVEPDEIGAVHYRQPDDNKSIILKFFYTGDGSAYDEILKRSRKVQPRGFYAKLMEVGDTDILDFSECCESIPYLRHGALGTISRVFLLPLR